MNVSPLEPELFDDLLRKGLLVPVNPDAVSAAPETTRFYWREGDADSRLHRYEPTPRIKRRTVRY